MNEVVSRLVEMQRPFEMHHRIAPLGMADLGWVALHPSDRERKSHSRRGRALAFPSQCMQYAIAPRRTSEHVPAVDTRAYHMLLMDTDAIVSVITGYSCP